MGGEKNIAAAAIVVIPHPLLFPSVGQLPVLNCGRGAGTWGGGGGGGQGGAVAPPISYVKH